MPSKPKEKTITIRGQRWTWSFSRKMKYKGTCDYSNNRIVLRHSKSHRDRLNTLVHEIIHASQRDLDEDAVNEIAEAIEVGIRIASNAGFFYQ